MKKAVKPKAAKAAVSHKKTVKPSVKPDKHDKEFGKVAPGWTRHVSYGKKGVENAAAVHKGVKSVQFSVTIKDDKDLEELKKKLTLVELALMQDARDLSNGVSSRKDVLVGRFLSRSWALGEIIGGLTSVWGKKFCIPEVEAAQAAERVK
jgi:hypothetical protein